MDLLDLKSPDPDHNKQSQFEANDELEIADQFRVRVMSHREQLEKAKMFYRHCQDTTQAAVLASDAARLYLEQLKSGWGAPIASVGPATLYEFGLTIPGYSGPLKGFSAISSQSGQIQHVSHVTSKTTSGAGCATLGCLAAGPVGAVAGATMGKKNDVRTDVQVIDNRRFEIQIIGPGVAWSYVGNYTIEESVRSFRDLLLARSTSTDDPKDLAMAQEQVVVMKSHATDLEYTKLQKADERLRSAQYAYETAWSHYESVRLPVMRDLLARWKKANIGIKIASIVFGPFLLLVWIAGLIFGNPNNSSIVTIAALVGIAQILLLALLGAYYRIEYRLLKTLPSESPKLEAVIRFFKKLQIRSNDT